MQRKIDTTQLLSSSIGVLGEEPARLLAWSLALQAPPILFALLIDLGTVTIAGKAASVLAVLAAQIPLIALAQLQTAILAPLVLDQLRGQGLVLPQLAVAGGARPWAVLALAAAVGVTAAAGFALFLIPGWLILTGLFVAMPALLCEGLSPWQALVRSWRLTGPVGLSIFALVFLFTIASALANRGLVALGMPATVGALAMVPISAVQAIAATVTYVSLATEAPGLEPSDSVADDGARPSRKEPLRAPGSKAC